MTTPFDHNACGPDEYYGIDPMQYEKDRAEDLHAQNEIKRMKEDRDDESKD